MSVGQESVVAPEKRACRVPCSVARRPELRLVGACCVRRHDTRNNAGLRDAVARVSNRLFMLTCSVCMLTPQDYMMQSQGVIVEGAALLRRMAMVGGFATDRKGEM